MTANVMITNPTSKSLPKCELYQCRCSSHNLSKRPLATMKKQRSLDNANQLSLSQFEKSEALSTTLNTPIVTNNIANSELLMLSSAVPIPVSLDKVKPIFDLSPSCWEPLWDEETCSTDSTTESLPPSPVNYEGCITANILDEDLIVDLTPHESSTDQMTTSILSTLTNNSDVTSKLMQINENMNNMINNSNNNSEIISNNNSEINSNNNSEINSNNNSEINSNNNNNINNNINNNDSKIVSKLTYKSSSDSLSSLSSSYTETSYTSNFTESYSSSSLTSNGGESPRRRVRDSEGYIRRAACVCVDETENQVMLTSSKKCEDVWLVPGGGLEDGEDAEEAAIREAWEEAGVKGRIARYLGVFQTQHEGSSKKHRTAVFVIIVTSLHDVFPEAHIGRHRRWFSLEDAQVQLDLHKPLQSEYLQFLVMNKLSKNINSSSSSSSSSSLIPSTTEESTLSTSSSPMNQDIFLQISEKLA